MASPSSADAAALYRRPFEILRSTSAAVRAVIPSAKLTPRALDPNRYYVDMTSFAPETTVAELRRVTAELAMPEAARRRLDEDLSQFGAVRFLGAGTSHGRMAYRVYLGFAGAEARTVHSAVSIDWDPLSGEHFVKEYDELRAIPRERELALLDELLLGEPGTLAREVHRFMVAVTGRARGALHVTLVREPAGRRSSAAFNYYRCAHTGNADLLPDLDRLAEALALPEEAYRAWRAATDGLPIVDIAAGRSSGGAPFVTIYHGPAPAPFPYVEGAAVLPACACLERAGPRLAYSLGQIAFDFGSRVQREAFVQAGLRTPHEAGALLAFLAGRPWWTESLLWLLTADGRPLYALRPVGAFAAPTFARLRQLLDAQERGEVERVAVPGRVEGYAVLESGETLPLLVPELRGISAWTTAGLVEAALAATPGADPERLRAGVLGLLQRIDAEVRSAGLTPRDRALGFSATQALAVGRIYADALAAGLALAAVTAGPSPRVRPGSATWDVELTFFDPERRSERARRVYRLTVDVSDRVPVAVGTFKQWSVY